MAERKTKVIRKPRKKTVEAPQIERPSDVVAQASRPSEPLREFSPSLCIVGTSDFSVFGRKIADRIREQFRRAGLTKEVAQSELAKHNGPAILVSTDGVLDQPLVAEIIKRPNTAIVSEKQTGSKVLAAHVRSADAEHVVMAMLEGKPLSQPGILKRAPSEMDANFWQVLRKRETPYALPLSTDSLQATEWRMFMGTYKGATDVVTKHLWPVPAFHVTRWLAPRGITPNMVTTVGAAMTVAAFFLFMYGYYGWGLLAAWVMTFLDTVDGKLARTTLTSSKWGDVFDHGIDLVHPPFWYFAWAFGLINWGINWSASMFWWTTGIILGGYVIQRLMEGISIKWLGLEIHIWREIDTLFRQITARRNPNLIVLTVATIIGRPDWGLLAVAAWTAACLLLHGVQLLQAFSARRRGPLQSWMTKS